MRPLKKRVELLYEYNYKKRDNERVISEMSKTFSLHQSDVILHKPPVIGFKARWPALFEPSQVLYEYFNNFFFL